MSPVERLEVLFGELAELTGQRNAIDGRIVEIVAEVDRDELWGATGARSIPALVAWKTGCSSVNARSIAAVANRVAEFPRWVGGVGGGRAVCGRGRGGPAVVGSGRCDRRACRGRV